MQNLSQKLIQAHLLSGRPIPGEEIGLKIDQTLMQDATGTMVMLEFESLGVPRVRTEVSVQYVDHNLLQADFRNADDHLFLRSACRRFGIWYSRPGNGVSHPVHMERFGVPGKSLLGSDSHTCSGGSMAMLAIGAGGLEVAVAMVGEPFFVKMPIVHGVKLTGKLPPWVGAKDVILELLCRHGVKGGVGRIFEFYGPGLEHLSAMDRHTIANMGAELGATTSVFPSDANLRRFLEAQGRGELWQEISADPGAGYDEEEEIDLSQLVPLIALPGSPGNVVAVASVAGRPIQQSYIGSSANPGLRDLAIAALIVAGKHVDDRVSLDINPASRQVLENLAALGHLQQLLHAGGRVHQAGCNGCIGMGQAPATGGVSLRTVPRNFPGRSGTKGDQVYLCGPETAAASALTGVITDPRTLGREVPAFVEPRTWIVNTGMFIAPDPAVIGSELAIGPNIKPLPSFDPLPRRIEGTVLLKTGDNVSTDDILPAGAAVLPFRSNIPEIAGFVFSRLDETFSARARAAGPGFFVVGGENYGQGSSREHAALAPRYLGLRVVIAKSFARIHWQNLINFGVLPLTFVNPGDWGEIAAGDVLTIADPGDRIKAGPSLHVTNITRGRKIEARHAMTGRQIEAVLSGSLLNIIRQLHRYEGPVQSRIFS